MRTKRNILNEFGGLFIMFGMVGALVSCQPKTTTPTETIKTDRTLDELQHDFVNTRYQAYFHYNMCTFKNLKEEEYQGRSRGTESAPMFNPTGLHMDQWVKKCQRDDVMLATKY